LSAHRNKPSPSRSDTACVVDDESVPWLAFAPHVDGVFVKYLKLDPLRGEAVALLRATAHARLPRQRYTGPVMAYTITGRWKLLEEDWIAGPGSLVVLPAAAARTACVVSDHGEALVLMVTTGERITLGADDKPLAIENCTTDLRRYRAWCESVRVVPRDLTACK
jgi:2,4'-dihydroxyacetophenone dioxygenase